MQPIVIDLLQRQFVIDIRHQNNGISILIVTLYNRSESLLTSSVPKLQLDEVSLHVERPYSWTIYLNLKSTPIVGSKSQSKTSSAYRRRSALFPTPDGPTKATLKMKSQFRCIQPYYNSAFHKISYYKVIASPNSTILLQQLKIRVDIRRTAVLTVQTIQKLFVMEQTQSKFSISIKPPLPNNRLLHSPISRAIPHSPNHLPLKRTSNNKSIQRASVEKSKQEKQIEKEIKYSKNIKPQSKNQISFIHSDTSAFANPPNYKLEESMSTVHKVRSSSRQKRKDSTWKRSELIEHADTKIYDSVGGATQSNNRRGSVQKNEDFYLYWKNKAHQYLQSNLKFMDQIGKLTKQNEELKEIVQKLKQKDKNKHKTQHKSDNNAVSDHTASQMRAISLHYLKKIEQMQKELKRKQIVIISYEIKIKELNKAIAGDNYRIKIINSLKNEIFSLKQENHHLLNKINIYKVSDEKGKQIHRQGSHSKIKTIK